MFGKLPPNVNRAAEWTRTESFRALKSKKINFKMLALLIQLVFPTGATPTPSPTACSHANKQIALYLDYEFADGESLSEMPATDISVGHYWNSTSAMRKVGQNGVYAAQPIGIAGGPGGYFGSQSDGDPNSGGLLFSIWDSVRPHPKGVQQHCSDPAKAPNETWCVRQHAFPLVSSCHRNCNDCGLHPGWHNTTGTQCSVHMELSEGDHIIFRLWQSSPNSTLQNPLGMGLNYHGAEWTLTATNKSNPTQIWTVGKMLLEDSYGGLTRFSAFHEHIGCTPCNEFYESEIRVGPYKIQPGNRAVKSIGFTRKNVSCELYEVSNAVVDGHPAAQISTGPGTGPGLLMQ